jgi:hypothetical protein
MNRTTSGGRMRQERILGARSLQAIRADPYRSI